MPTTWEYVQKIFLVTGGLGLFLFGMKMMSDGLKNMAGSRLRDILEKATSNKFLGIAVGAGVSFLIHSSAATTSMVVGFVNAGLMTLTQATGVIIGANVGTTFTTQILVFKIDPFAPLIIFVGLVMYMFFKKKSIRDAGFIVLGLGILFYGISVMGGQMKEFAEMPGFQAMLEYFKNPVLALLAGILFTFVVQSSTATISVIMLLNFAGGIPFQTIAFLVMGCNVGTCGTALIASLAAGRESKRAALVHTVYNIISCVVFGTLIAAVPGVLVWLQNTWTDAKQQVAMFHTLYNIASALLLMFFTKQLAGIVCKILPRHPDEDGNSKKLLYLDHKVLNAPAEAVTQSHRELCRMGEITLGNLQLSLDALFTKDIKKPAAVLETEETLNFFYNQITAWLVRLQGLELSAEDLEKLGIMLHTVSDIERLGDHAEHIAEYTMLEEKRGAKISDPVMNELRTFSEAAVQMVTLSLDIFANRDEARLPLIKEQEQRISSLSKACRGNHFQYLKDESGDPRGVAMFIDMMTDLERCVYYSANIAFSVVSEETWSAGEPELLQSVEI